MAEAKKADTDTSLSSSQQQQQQQEMVIPPTMKVAVATGFGDIDDNIFIREDWPTPTLPKDDNDNDYLIIKVLACALAPGDVRVLSGKTDYMQMPESGHPYVIGSDVSGIVVAVNASSSSSSSTSTKSKFQVGDYVVSRFDEPKPNGGVAEYRLVRTALTEHCPSTIDPLQACGLTASAMAAKTIVRKYVSNGDRVLVIGGSGGVGSHVLQYAKLYGASFVAAVSTQQDQCLRLGADQVIDYRTHKWWEMPEFQQVDNRFTVVFDMVNGENWVKGGNAGTAIDPQKGVYVPLLTGVDTDIEVHGVLDIFPVMCQFLGTKLWSYFNPRLPRWDPPEALKLNDGDLKELLDDVVQGRLKPIVDPSSPFAFDQDGVRQAMALQKSKHAHGKVVIRISSK